MAMLTTRLMEMLLWLIRCNQVAVDHRIPINQWSCCQVLVRHLVSMRLSKLLRLKGRQRAPEKSSFNLVL